MHNIQRGFASADEREDLRERPLGPYYRRESNPPEPSQIFTRLSVLLLIALGFGLAGELLSQLPQ